MSAVASMPQSIPPIPTDLQKLLHSAKTPWHLSPALFERLKKQLVIENVAGKPFAAVQITNQDPEYAFVLRYFQHQKPPHFSIKSILCIHNPDQTKFFEAAFTGMEENAKSFSPGWNQEEPKAHRNQTIDRWKACVAPFSPFQIPSSKRVDTFTKSKIIPLWHGSKQVDSICKSGFAFFGKHHFFDKNATAGSQASTDIGFFGSGIYFTNSPHYASMYHSGSLLLSWISMREPYPVVNDVSIPKKGSDMIKLQGKGAYQNYNAHYIPVTSTDPSSPDNMIYHPCHYTEQPAWDEYVVFEKSQALPRFIVELGVDLPVAPSSASITLNVKTLTDQLMIILDNAEIKSDSVMSKLLTEKLEHLFSLNPNNPLLGEDLTFYNRVMQLLDPQGKIRSLIKEQFTKSQATTQKLNAKEDPSLVTKITKSDTAAAITTAAVATTSGNNLNQKTEVSFDPESVNKADADGNTPLHKAAEAGNAELCKTLLAAGADFTAMNKRGYDALQMAANHGSHEIIPLYATYKSLINPRFNQYESPLMMAAMNGHIKTFEALLKIGADPLFVLYPSNRNSLHYVAEKGCDEIVSILVNYKQLLNAIDFNGETPLFKAALGGHFKTCETLLHAGADSSIPDRYNRTPLYMAVNCYALSKNKDYLLKTCEALLRAGADPHIVIKNGQRSLGDGSSAFSRASAISSITSDNKIIDLFAPYKKKECLII